MPSAALCRNRLRNFLQPWPRLTASRFAPLFNPQCSPADLSLDQLYQLLPIKGQFDMPVAHQDGAGIFSVPDWSFPPSGMQDRHQARSSGSACISFSKSGHRSGFGNMCRPALSHLFLRMLKWSLFGLSLLISWRPTRLAKWTGASSPSQPYTLRALQQLSEALEDPDTDLFACLQEGAPTGFFKDIPRSGVFIPVQDESVASDQPLLLCEENWKGARDNPETLAALVQEELANDWLEGGPAGRRLGNDGRTLPSAS